MEWTWTQQLTLLLQSTGLGLVLGMLFDIMGGIARALLCKKRSRFWWDVLYGLLAALVTFFGSLSIMDGRMHPLLFAGCLVGFVAEHVGPGRPIGWLACRLSRGVKWVFRCFVDKTEALIMAAARAVGHIFICQKRKIANKSNEGNKNKKKSRKKFRFFQKNS